jgi:hypothetical protein
MSAQSSSRFTDLKVVKHRGSSHQFTEVSFTLTAQHKIKVELLGGVLKTTFIIWVDDKEVFRKALYTLLLQFIRYSCKLDNVDCAVKYFWLSGIWQGHIYVDGDSVV